MCRSIILLAGDEEGPDQSDARILRILLSLQSFQHEMKVLFCACLLFYLMLFIC